MKTPHVKMAILLLLSFLIFNTIYGSDIDNNKAVNIINKYNKMAPEQLLEMGSSFSRRNINDSAMMCFSLIYNNQTENKSIETKQIICKALNKASIIYIYNCNYKMGLELLLRALEICEEINYKSCIGRIYNNMGNLYYRFNDYELANKYFKLAYENSFDNVVLGGTLNNLGILAHREKKLDSALLLYKQVCAIKPVPNDSIYSAPLNNIALIFQSLKEYDSAFLYYNKALVIAKKLRSAENEAKILSNIGKMYFEFNKLDSAMYYFGASSVVAEQSKLLVILSDNYLLFSKIEEKRGNMKTSFDYYKKHSTLKDSILNLSEYATLNEVQFMYDMSKLDKQIKSLSAEQEIRERTIAMQKRLQIVMGLALLTVIGFLIMLYLKNKTLNVAYSVLVIKNLEVINSDKINYQSKLEYKERLKERELVIEQLKEELASITDKADIIVENNITRHHNMGLSDDSKRELELAILEIMNDKKVFCDADFSLTKLSEMVGSNFNYISHIINSSFNSNFKTFIHEYRIKEACRMFSDPAYKKYSIETIANMVGFKSKGSFNPIFKEITGVTPSFYIKSLKCG